MRRFILIGILLIASTTMVQSQVLISLLFGDKLNSETIKFGLDGGMNVSSISGINSQRPLVSWNLGFYFDFMLKKNPHWYIHTGVLVKSTMGAREIEYTSVNDPELDSLFRMGTIDRKLNYFNVPILAKYKLDNGLFFELGPMLSLMYKAYDVYDTEYLGEELTLAVSTKDSINRLDVGVEAGIGYYLAKRDGIYVGIRYYQGLRNVRKNEPQLSNLNSSFFLYASIPIGAGDKAKEKQAESKKKKEAKKAEKAERKAAKEAAKKQDKQFH
jgi:hypothetical protein